MKKFYESLAEKLYAGVEYPKTLTDHMKGVDLWRQFCELPQEIKSRFAFSNHQIGTKDPGYKERERQKGREDKWYFHYTGENDTLIAKDGLSELVQNNSTLKAFFDFSQLIYKKAGDVALSIAKDLDRKVPGIFKEVEEGRHAMVMRFLYYNPQSPTDMSLADPHVDRSGYTLHLYESHPGLELMNLEERWIPAPMGEGHTIVFGGYQLEKKSKGEIRATWHRVNRISGVNDRSSRTSIVFFVPFLKSPSYPKDERLQKLTPGYGKRDW